MVAKGSKSNLPYFVICIIWIVRIYSSVKTTTLTIKAMIHFLHQINSWDSTKRCHEIDPTAAETKRPLFQYHGQQCINSNSIEFSDLLWDKGDCISPIRWTFFANQNVKLTLSKLFLYLMCDSLLNKEPFV